MIGHRIPIIFLLIKPKSTIVLVMVTLVDFDPKFRFLILCFFLQIETFNEQRNPMCVFSSEQFVVQYEYLHVHRKEQYVVTFWTWFSQ